MAGAVARGGLLACAHELVSCAPGPRALTLRRSAPSIPGPLYQVIAGGGGPSRSPRAQPNHWGAC